MWNLSVPMHDSFSVRWTSRMWIISRDCLQQSLLIRRRLPEIPDLRSVPLRRSTIICVFFGLGLECRTVLTAEKKSKSRRSIRSWIMSCHTRNGPESRSFLLLSAQKKENMLRSLKMLSVPDMYVFVWTASFMICRKRSSWKRTKSTALRS